MIDSIIADYPPSDGREWDCQCARCGSSCSRVGCWECFGECDPECGQCSECRGRGGWWTCLSSLEWCRANPIKGHENVAHGEIEWFVVRCADECSSVVIGDGTYSCDCRSEVRHG
jgi:hypothetical protein